MVFLAVLPALAESVDTAWVRRYNGPGNSDDYPNAIAVDDYRNVYVTGQSIGSETGDDFATIKYYPDGDTAWLRRYNGPGNGKDMGFAIAVDGSNNVYVTGQGKGSVTGYDYTTIKYNPDGDTAWLRSYNGPGNGTDYAVAIAVDGSNNVYVTGESVGSGTNGDYATIKYSPDGDTAWVRRYNGQGNHLDKAQAIAIDDSGNVYVTGCSIGDGTHNDYATIKYRPNGDTAWVRRYHRVGGSQEWARAIAVDDSGNVYVTGNGQGDGTDYDFVTIKYYPDGDTAWLRRYNGPANGMDFGRAIAVDDSGYVYVTGYSESTDSYRDYATVKYDASGNEVWVRRYNGPPGNGTDEAFSLTIDDFSNVYVTETSGGGASDLDFATIKYHPNGDSAWATRYDGLASGTDDAYAIAVDDSGNVYVTGWSSGSGTGYDYVTIKYVQSGTHVQDETGTREKPSEFALSQNYPNPFNQITKIEFLLAKSGFVSLEIYDILGRKVRALVAEQLSSGYKSVLWDGKNESGKDVASGIYFYQLRVGDFSETRRLVMLK
jgi:hypothetical protein